MERGFDVCSPRGGRHSRKSNWSMATIFLSTPSARRATLCRWAADHRWRISIHALREEGDKDFIFIKTITNLFLSTPSARRATAKVCHGKSLSYDFYPRPPRGGRPITTTARPRPRLRFLSTPSARRATGSDTTASAIRLFLSTPSARRATAWTEPVQPAHGISIHALREEGDVKKMHDTFPRLYFYPRPPRGGRQCKLHDFDAKALFLSTPSARRATSLSRRPFFRSRISIHALREEGDLTRRKSLGGLSDFYPRPPRGGRPASPFA